MATLVLGALGTLIGGPIGGSIGALLGRSVDSRIFGGGRREGPRLSELRLSTSSYGVPIPRQFGRMRVAGQIIWATDLVERRESQGGGKGSPSVTAYNYSISFAVALSSRPIRSIGRIWADGKLLRGEAGDLKTGGVFRFHPGTADQEPDPLIAAAEGIESCPAYRGLAYGVFEDLQLAEFGNRIPSLSFEIIADESPLSLSDLIADTITDCNADVPLPGLSGLSGEGPVGETIAMHDPFFPIGCDAGGERLAFQPDNRSAPPILLPEAATSSSEDDFGGKTGFARQRARLAEAPIAMLRYYDIERDYQPGAQRVSGRAGPGQPQTLELPASMSAGTALRLIEQASRRGDWSRQTLSWRMTQLDPDVAPGATVRLDGHPGLWRVREWEWRAHGVELNLVRLDPGPGPAELPADPGRASLPDDAIPGPTGLIACELPWDGSASTPVPLILALASSPSPGWSGASLYADRGDGGLEPLGPSGRIRAVIGTSLSALAPASPLLLDRHGTVTVRLIGADLSLADSTMRQLALGANRALLGSEIIQFARAEPLGGGDWCLSGLWRGRGGTESAIGTHLAGEPFALLDGSGTSLPAQLASLAPGMQIVGIGLGDTAPVTSPIRLSGIGTRPISPVHGRFESHADGAFILRWTRRARGGWIWPEGLDLPLGEQAEVYEVEYGNAVQATAAWETTAPELTLDASTLAELQMSLPAGRFAIRQRGDRARSEPLHVDPPSL